MCYSTAKKALEGAYMVERAILDRLQAKGFPAMQSSEVTTMLAEAIAEMEIKLPDDVKDFIRFATLELQAHRSRTDEQKDSLFRRAYKLYAKYDVEGV